MSAEKYRLLICTNGAETNRPALEYGVWLAGLLKSGVILLGVVEHPSELGKVDRFMDETRQKLESMGLPLEIRQDQGRGTLVIARHAAGIHNCLTVVGPLGRPVWRRLVQGRSFRRLLAQIASPILYVPQVRLPLKRILLCLGGLGYARDAERLGLILAKAAGAQITLLHVVEPITLDYPLSHEIHAHLQDILETDTPQGRNLSAALRRFQAAGVPVEFKLRQGSVVQEIIEQVASGEYDLIGMGSAYSAHSLRHLYMPNVTAEVAESLNLPVFSARLEEGKEDALGVTSQL